MQQPKFKFGDMVRPLPYGTPFSVTKISLRQDSYYYNSSDRLAGIPENELELFREPKSKKLYAYTMNGAVIGETNEVRFYRKELDKDWKAFIRAPEYDIEYNAEALCKEQENTERR